MRLLGEGVGLVGGDAVGLCRRASYLGCLVGRGHHSGGSSSKILIQIAVATRCATMVVSAPTPARRPLHISRLLRSLLMRRIQPEIAAPIRRISSPLPTIWPAQTPRPWLADNRKSSLRAAAR